MSDDISRARSRRANAAAPTYAAPIPFDPRPIGRDRTRGSRINVPVTHELQVQDVDTKCWLIAHRGSERACAATLDLKRRHWPDREYRVLTIAEAAADRRRKTWSVKDADHVRSGERVMLRRSPAEIHLDIVKVHAVFGLSRESEETRTGVVVSRHRRIGDYMIKLDGTELTISVVRADLIWPVLENVVPLARRAGR